MNVVVDDPGRLALPVPPGRAVRAALAGIMALALGLALVRLGDRSFWQDEGFTWSTVDRSFGSMLALVARDESYQIVHTLLMWPLNRISGTEWVLRLPSALAYAAATGAVFVVARRLHSDAAGLIAALVFAVNGFLLEYAMEARSYMLAAAFVGAAAAACAGAVADPTPRRRRWWLAWGVLAIWTHGFAVLAVAAVAASALVLPVGVREPLRLGRHAAWTVGLSLPALVLPALQVGQEDVWFISRPGLGAVVGYVWFVAGRTVTMMPVYGAAVLVGAVIATRALRRDGRSVVAWRWLMPLTWLLVPPLALMAVSLVRQPIWVARYGLWSVPGACVLLGMATAALVRRPRARVLAAVVLAALASRGVVKWFDEPTGEDYRAAMRVVAARAAPGDAIIFTPDEVRIPSEYYLGRSGALDHLVPVYPDAPFGEWGTGDHDAAGVPAARVRAARDGFDTIWVVRFGRADEDPRFEADDEHLRLLDDGFRVDLRERFRGPVTVWRYVRR